MYEHPPGDNAPSPYDRDGYVAVEPVAGILLRQFYLIRGSPVRSLPMFAWVGIDIVVWGFITRYLNSMAVGRYNYVPSLLGAVLLWDFVTRIMQGVLAGQPPSAAKLAVGAALAVLDILLAGYFFARVFGYAVRTGLLARYSAESAA